MGKFYTGEEVAEGLDIILMRIKEIIKCYPEIAALVKLRVECKTDGKFDLKRTFVDHMLWDLSGTVSNFKKEILNESLENE